MQRRLSGLLWAVLAVLAALLGAVPGEAARAPVPGLAAAVQAAGPAQRGVPPSLVPSTGTAQLDDGADDPDDDSAVAAARSHGRPGSLGLRTAILRPSRPARSAAAHRPTGPPGP